MKSPEHRRIEVVLVSNYLPDRQESMIRFADWLLAGAQEAGISCSQIHPEPLLGRLFPRVHSGIGKWLAYIDKFVLFPLLLLIGKDRRGSAVYHIVDHSNAMYLRWLPRKRVMVTCHDVLAVRGGLGDAGAYCPASRKGRFLQRWILASLRKARHLICVSETTSRDYLGLPGGTAAGDQELVVIPNGLNRDFSPFAPAERRDALGSLSSVLPETYFFHVGSGLARKNRTRLIEAFDQVASRMPGVGMVFAGGDFQTEEVSALERCAGRARVVHAGEVSHEQLRALYSGACALVFPSLSEGFGWPIIEAQACDCPVVCSSWNPMAEVAGEGGLCVDPLCSDSIAEGMLAMIDSEARTQWVGLGRRNLKRFTREHTLDLYLNLYRRISEEHSLAGASDNTGT